MHTGFEAGRRESSVRDLREGRGTERALMQRALLALIQAYQLAVRPLLGPHCRFYPSCSAYAAEAIRRHGAGAGCWLALKRVARCHPMNPGGVDPVPPR